MVSDRLGTKVIEVNNVSKAFGDRQLMEDVSFSVPPGSIVGKPLSLGSISGIADPSRCSMLYLRPRTLTMTASEVVHLCIGFHPFLLLRFHLTESRLRNAY